MGVPSHCFNTGRTWVALSVYRQRKHLPRLLDAAHGDDDVTLPRLQADAADEPFLSVQQEGLRHHARLQVGHQLVVWRMELRFKREYGKTNTAGYREASNG